MGSPYREDVAALRERRDTIARELEENEASAEKLRTELVAMEVRLSLRPPLSADRKPAKWLRAMLGLMAVTVLAGILVHLPTFDRSHRSHADPEAWMNATGYCREPPVILIRAAPPDRGARTD